MLLIHVAAGFLSLAAGAVALSAAKGSVLHRRSGLVFAVAMLVMTASAVVIAAFQRPNAVNVMAGTLTFYLVATGVLTVRGSIGPARALTIGFMSVALAMSVFAFGLAVGAVNSGNGLVDGVPAPPLFLFAAIGLLGASGDARLLRAGEFQGARRLARHLWRMSFAMFVATASFFLGQARLFPQAVRESGLLAVPVLLVVLTMLYWLLRIRRRPPRPAGPTALGAKT